MAKKRKKHPELIALFLVILLWGSSFFLLKVPDEVTRGTFGDMFGAVNALFSGLAFIGIIYTIYLQKEELRLQREELKLTRRELKKAAEAQEKSSKSLETTAKLNALSAMLNHQGNVMIAKSNDSIAEASQKGSDSVYSPFERSFLVNNIKDTSKADAIVAEIKKMINF